ncbi:MAG: hypothetical protein JSU87_17825 [Gemmatimonadota bacterium]|nr:MAG: hypothetical protein JSU87_17825 [Gemmatimonadota bacterium]
MRFAAGLAALFLVSPIAWRRIERSRLLRRIASKDQPVDGLPSAEATLNEMGLYPDAIEEILSAASAGEVVVAELDQNNRVLSHFGSIGVYAGTLIEPADFQPRSRNRMQIVVDSGLVAIKKTYSARDRFINEVLSLDALKANGWVPRIISIDSKRRILYQSFITSENLGSLMAERGASVGVQYQVGKAYPGPGLWHDNLPRQDQREALLRALHSVVGEEFLVNLEKLVELTHQVGVSLRDVKHGNVLIRESMPYLCDFDLSHRFSRDGVRSLLARDRERDRFNYMFGRDLPTMQSLRCELASIVAQGDESEFPPAYFGKGHSFGRLRPTYAGSGKWRMLRKYLPEIRGARIVDLGSGQPVVLAEMLRAGAAAAITFEPDPIHVRFASLIQRYFELVDNRSYDLKVVQGELGSFRDCDLSGYDLAVAFAGPRSPGIETICAAVSRLDVTTNLLLAEHAFHNSAAEAERDRWRQRLADCGFPHQRPIPVPGHPVGLVLARRHPA